MCAAAGAFPPYLLDELAKAGVLAGTIDPDTVRFVTHHDVDDRDLTVAIDALHAIAAAE